MGNERMRRTHKGQCDASKDLSVTHRPASEQFLLCSCRARGLRLSEKHTARRVPRRRRQAPAPSKIGLVFPLPQVLILLYNVFMFRRLALPDLGLGLGWNARATCSVRQGKLVSAYGTSSASSECCLHHWPEAPRRYRL